MLCPGQELNPALLDPNKAQLIELSWFAKLLIKT
jgi:hypothetical protein